MKRLANGFVFGLAALAFLAPLKFGAPSVVQWAVPLPADVIEALYFTWPNEVAIILVFVGFTWLVLDRERMLARVDLLFVLPLLFLLTQVLASPWTICVQETIDTVLLFAAAVLLFYVAAWYVRDGAATGRIFGGLALATLFVCILAMQQHFGGLEETRAYAASHIDTSAAPRDFLLRMTSNRVFGPFVYPNALAGFLVVAFAPVLAWIWVRARGWDARVKWVVMVFTAGVMLFCLLLTGSRGGLGSFAVMALAVLWCLAPRGGRRTMGAMIVLVAALGVVVLLARHGGLLHFGTGSLEARTDYWGGAVRIIKDHPWVGTGPGTFGSIYPAYKTALTEEAEAVHNNYLQMWSDSGVLAFLAFGALWVVGVWHAFRLAHERRGDVAAAAICGALAGWAVHGLLDFELYVPGVALPAFTLLGVVQGLKELPRTDTVATRRRRATWAVAVACTGLVAGVVWFEGMALAAGYQCEQARELVGIHPFRALEDAREAAALEPWNSRLQMCLGDIALRTRNGDEAIAAYRRAVDGDPYRASCWWQLARANTAVHGVDAESIRILSEAVKLNPTNARYSEALAAAKESVRQSDGALLQSVPAKEARSSK
ncbi:MAG TPA: O-antigen ligase family protein [Verrucomicrobiae bacterium]|nr:O-antigen ligase family protein [Verrucomicrobiae bacterium]